MKENKKYLIIFIIIILLFIAIFVYNKYKNRDLNDNRIILGKYAYSEVINESNQVFLNAVKILNTNNFDFEKNHTNGIRYYSINNYDEYKRIDNFLIAINTLNYNDLRKYMKEKDIIKVENNYYIKNYEDNINKEYIGSIIEIDDYDDKYIYFKSNNYYCEDKEYIGLLDSAPDCNYKLENSTFKMFIEDDKLKISNIEDIKKIVT